MVLLKESSSPTDAGLVEEFRRGDGAAFDELVRRYKDRLYNVVYRYLGNHEDARDVVQEVFIRAHSGLHAFKGQSMVCTWLHSIAANLARNRVRDLSRRGRNKGLSLEALQERAAGRRQFAADGESPSGAAQRRELEEALTHCLEDLPDSYRMAFILRTFDNLSYGDIAEAVGCPAGTVKSRLNQARRRLRDCLTHHGVV